MEHKKPEGVTILGSTGSIGTQTLDIIAANPTELKVAALTANTNWELLASQARKYRACKAVIADERYLPQLRAALEGSGIETASGTTAISEVASMAETDTVVTAMVGYSGLLPTTEAAKAGKKIALANKETLVAGGSVVLRLARRHGARIVPVDSEHSAIFQCMHGEDPAAVRRIILTASGGPFRTLPAEKFAGITVAEALRHPNWSMGRKVTVDSATMMNKGLEMIEARWLFDCPPGKIDVLVHPQSVVHSMVEFHDGSIKAQLGVPDMHLPISHALSYPARYASASPPLSLEQLAGMTFEKPDVDKFPLLATAYEAIARGGTAPCSMNAANEIAVAAFLAGNARFTEIPVLVEATMAKADYDPDPDLETLGLANAQAREIAASLIKKTLV